MLSGNDLILTLKGLKVIFDFKVTLWHQASNKETTVNKNVTIIWSKHQTSHLDTSVNMECDNYMKQIFKTCENAFKVLYHIIFLEILQNLTNLTKLYQKVYVKNGYCIRNPSTESCFNWRKEKLNYQLQFCYLFIQEKF